MDQRDLHYQDGEDRNTPYKAEKGPDGKMRAVPDYSQIAQQATSVPIYVSHHIEKAQMDVPGVDGTPFKFSWSLPPREGGYPHIVSVPTEEQIKDAQVPKDMTTKDIIDGLQKMDKEAKYYTPSIEDVRIGYEFEVKITNPNRSDLGNWESTVIGDDYGEWKCQKLIDALATKEPIRVPFLSKEQIESEGWIYIGNGHEGNCYEKKGGTLSECQELWYNFSKRKAVIWKNTVQIIYEGSCPSINELRVVQKLLGI